MLTVSRPSLRIRRGRWRTRALAASPTAAERTARCSTEVRRAPKNSSAMARSLLFALLRFLCRPGRWSTRLKLQRPPEGSAQGAHSRFPGHALTPTGVMAIRCKQFHLPDL